MIRNSGHFTPADGPERFNEAVIAFLSKRGWPFVFGDPEDPLGLLHVGVSQAASYEKAESRSF
jgi:hypothetical protein